MQNVKMHKKQEEHLFVLLLILIDEYLSNQSEMSEILLVYFVNIYFIPIICGWQFGSIVCAIPTILKILSS